MEKLIILFLAFQMSLGALFLPEIDTSAIYELKLTQEVHLQWQVDYETEQFLAEVTFVNLNSDDIGETTFKGN